MEKTITLIGENNEEIIAEILFTFVHDEENFVLLTLEDSITEIENLEDEYPVLAYKYEELDDGTIGNLIEIADNSSDWEIVEEMFNTFNSEDFEDDVK